MGYGQKGQETKGIHIRQHSRAFVFEQNGTRSVFVSADCALMGQLVKKKVVHLTFNVCFKKNGYTFATVYNSKCVTVF